jgi:rubrerythrin
MPGTSEDHDADQTAGGAQGPEGRRPVPATEAAELPGDSVCWLRLVCAECGAMAESEPPTNCPQCGAPLLAGR